MRIATAVLGACLLFAPAVDARAEVDEATVSKLRALMDAGKAAEAQALLEKDDLASRLTAEPLKIRLVCVAAARGAEAMGKADGDKALAVAGGLVTSATKALETHTGDADCSRALAFALVARGRASRAAGKNTTAEDWAAAVDALVKCPAAKKDEGTAVKDATEILLDAPVSDRRSSGLVVNRLSAVSAMAVEYHKKQRDALIALARANYDFANDPAFEKKADMKALLKNCLACLRPFIKKPDDEVANLHYDAVTMERWNKLVLKEKYLTKSDASLDGLIEFDVPNSKRWKVLPATSTISRTVRQYDEDGKVQHAVRFRKFSFAIDYIFTNGTRVGGDNAKGLAKLAMEQKSNLLPDEKKRTKPKKGKLNKKLGGYSARMEGNDPEGKPIHLHIYVFRGSHMMTYEVILIDRLPEEGFDPAMKAFIASMRERK